MLGRRPFSSTSASSARTVLHGCIVATTRSLERSGSTFFQRCAHDSPTRTAGGGQIAGPSAIEPRMAASSFRAHAVDNALHIARTLTHPQGTDHREDMESQQLGVPPRAVLS
jgi:hypothetical protein